MGLISAWFKHAESRHNSTIPLALDTNSKLLCHSADLLTPSGTIMLSFCSLLIPPGLAFEVHMPHVSEVFCMACYPALAAMKMFHQSDQCHELHLQNLLYFLWTIGLVLLLKF